MIDKVKRIEFIDFAKGFAMLTIVLFHYFQFSFDGILRTGVIFGGTGVHLFIFISGFGLGLTSQNLSFVTFFKKRFSRLLIPYYLFVILVFLINKAIQIYPDDGFYALVGHIFLFKMFDESIVTSLGYHLWFISAIIQLYLVFPLLIIIKRKFGVFILGILSIIISILYWIILIIYNLDDFLVISNSGVQFLWEFSLGIILADYYKANTFKFWEINKSLLLIFMIIGTSVMAILAIYGGRTGKTLNDIPALFGYTSLVIIFYSIARNLKLVNKFFLFLGKISFELYLLHMLVFTLIYFITKEVEFIKYPKIYFTLFIVLPISIMISYVFNSANQKITKILNNYF